MRRLFALLFALGLAQPTLAAEPPAGPPAFDAALSAVAELGRINGLALACRLSEVAARTKELMLARVPKTRRYGEAYEEATSRAFLAVPGGCPEAAALRLEAEVAAAKIQAALPAGQ